MTTQPSMAYRFGLTTVVKSRLPSMTGAVKRAATRVATSQRLGMMKQSAQAIRVGPST
jgi:hypothetical protein